MQFLASISEIGSSSTGVVPIASAVAVGIGAQVLGRYLRIPSIVFLLLFGLVLGPGLIGAIDPGCLGSEGLETLISLAVAVILFEGGLSLDLRSLTKLSGSLRNLVTVGTAIALFGGALAAHYVGGFPWQLSFLYASLVVVTGPTVVGPLLQQVRVDSKVSSLLEGEGVLIDPIGAFVAILVLNAIAESPDPATLGQNVLVSAAVGIAVGASAGWALGWVLKHARFLDGTLKSLVVLAAALSLFAFSQSLCDESGLLAAVVAGIVFNASEVPEQQSFRPFQKQVTVLGVSVVFVLLAADLPLEALYSLGWGSLLTVLVLMAIVRPLSVWLCTLGSDLNWRQKLFVSWIGPKGIVSASVASLFATEMGERGIAGGETVRGLVFLTILMTVVIESLSARWLADSLQVTAPQAREPRDSAAIAAALTASL